jgi:hypothetical protein
MLFNIKEELEMKKKIVGIFVCILLITTILPITAMAGDEQNPEVKDRTRDVKLFGLFTLFPQSLFTYVDIVSAWMYEEEDHPEQVGLAEMAERGQDDQEERLGPVQLVVPEDTEIVQASTDDPDRGMEDEKPNNP